MGLFISDDERKAVNQAMAAGDEAVCRRYWSLVQRVRRWTGQPGLLSLDSDAEWWYLAADRLFTVAGMHAISPKAAGADGWLRDTVLGIVRRPADDWVGPYFRDHDQDPPMGHLETAHLSWAVTYALDCAPGVFSDAERMEVENCLRQRAIPMCRRWFDIRNSQMNWRVIMLAGAALPAALLGDKDTLAWVHEEYRAYCRDRFQDDGSYGESLQYAGYTIFGLMLINETLRRADPERFGSLDLEPYVHTVRWWATALLYVKPLAGWGQHALPRSVNFNDSAAIFRPQADILMHIAARARDSHPTEAGLARWLHDQCYATAEALPHDRGTFGLVPDDNILSLVLLPQAAAAISPATAGCDPLQAHEVGTVFARDAWNGQTILAVSGQDQQQRVQNHNHQDLNHFILCHRGERLLVDPGHCCYRTPVYGLAKQSGSHNTCTIAGHEQVRRGGSRLLCERRSSVQAIAHDVGPAYPDPVREFSRLFLLCGSKALFIVDRIRADEAVDAFWHFVFNNRDGALEIAQLKPGRIVARRGDAGMKLVDGGETRCQGPFYHHIHDAYHPLPAQNGEGQSGSGLMFKHSSGEKRREILRIHGIALDSYGRIPRWHLDPHATGMLIHEKDGARWDLDIHSDPDAWRLRGPDTDLTITTNTAQWSIA